MQASKYLITLAFVLATAVHAAAEDWVLIETKTAEANGTQIKASDWGNTKTFKRESADVRTLDERTEFAITTADGTTTTSRVKVNRSVNCATRETVANSLEFLSVTVNGVENPGLEGAARMEFLAAAGKVIQRDSFDKLVIWACER